LQWLYLNHATGDSSSLTFTAGFLCVPVAFLLWAIISLTAAVLHFAFRSYIGISLTLLACIASVIIFAVLCAVLFLWIWNEPDDSSIPKRLGNALRNFQTVPKEDDVMQRDEVDGDALPAEIDTQNPGIMQSSRQLVPRTR
jgi:hypothetical protein